MRFVPMRIHVARLRRDVSMAEQVIASFGRCKSVFCDSMEIGKVTRLVWAMRATTTRLRTYVFSAHGFSFERGGLGNCCSTSRALVRVGLRQAWETTIFVYKFVDAFPSRKFSRIGGELLDGAGPDTAVEWTGPTWRSGFD